MKTRFLCIFLSVCPVYIVGASSSDPSLPHFSEHIDHAINALTRLETSTSDLLAQQNQVQTKSDTIALGAGLLTMYVLSKLGPIVRYKAQQHRFITGLELPAVAGILSPLVTPVAYLVGGGLVYWTIKGHFADPYKRKLELKMTEMKQLLARHKEEMNRALDRHRADTETELKKRHEALTQAQAKRDSEFKKTLERHALTTEAELKRGHDAAAQARHNIVTIQQQVENDLTGIRTHYVHELNLVKKQTAKDLEKERQANALLKAGLEQQMKLLVSEQTSSATALHEQLKKEHDQLMANVHTLTSTVETNLTGLGTDVRAASTSTQELQEKFKKIIPHILVMEQSIKNIRQSTEKELLALGLRLPAVVSTRSRLKSPPTSPTARSLSPRPSSPATTEKKA